MNLSQESLKAAKELLCGSPLRIVVVSHTNPDGDAIGSSLALREALTAHGHTVTCIVPNKYPYYLDWIPNIQHLLIFKNDHDKAVAAINEAEVIICADLNMLARLDDLGVAIAGNTTAKKVGYSYLAHCCTEMRVFVHKRRSFGCNFSRLCRVCRFYPPPNPRLRQGLCLRRAGLLL